MRSADRLAFRASPYSLRQISAAAAHAGARRLNLLLPDPADRQASMIATVYRAHWTKWSLQPPLRRSFLSAAMLAKRDPTLASDMSDT
jgi:hypothetical protein